MMNECGDSPQGLETLPQGWNLQAFGQQYNTSGRETNLLFGKSGTMSRLLNLESKVSHPVTYIQTPLHLTILKSFGLSPHS